MELPAAPAKKTPRSQAGSEQSTPPGVSSLGVEDRPDRGRVFIAPFDVVFSFHDIVEPDVIFVAPDQLDILTDKNIQGTPAMVVEILSPSTRQRDRQIKRTLYERSGVREYWLVDPDLDVVTVHRRSASGAFPVDASLSVEGSDTLATPLLPGWSLTLERLFRCSDKPIHF